MARPVRILTAAALAAALSGCTIALHGNQSSSGGVTTTTTSSRVVGSVKASGARVSFSSGPVVPANAPGGHVALNRGAAAVLVLGLVIADAVSYFRLSGSEPPRMAPAAESIADTCSCYGYRAPVRREE